MPVDLAAESLADDDPVLAVWVARCALTACPGHVRLYGSISQAHNQASDAAAYLHTWRELQPAAGDDGVPSEVLEYSPGGRRLDEPS